MKDKGRSKKKTSSDSDSSKIIIDENASSPEKGKDKSKKNTSLRLDKQTLKALKIKAIENDTSIQKLIERLILDYLD